MSESAHELRMKCLMLADAHKRSAADDTIALASKYWQFVKDGGSANVEPSEKSVEQKVG